MNQKNLRFQSQRPSVAAFVEAPARVPARTRRRPLASATTARRQAAVVAVVVVALHAVALYAVTRSPATTRPQVSLPLTVSFATTAEPMRATPKPAPPKSSSPRSTPPRPVPTPMPRTVSAPVSNPSTTAAPAAPPPSETASPQEEPAPPSVSAPRFDAAYLNNPAPAYPALSRRLSEEGRVLLRVYVGPDGRAREVHLQASSGYARLDHAAQDAVARWQFVPARRGAESVGAWVLVPISFSLKQG